MQPGQQNPYGGQGGGQGDPPGAGGPPLGSTAPAADLPPVPLPQMSGFAKGLIGFGMIIIAGYAAIAITGWEPAAPKRDEIPASVRSSPGGYRSFHFWHSGYHGGK